MRSALVTGASRGIGRAIAEHLAAAGWGLTLTSRREEDLRPLAAALGDLGSPHVAHLPADMSDVASLPALVDLHGETFGSMGALVLNAGMASRGPVESFSLSRFQRTVAVNLTSAFVLTSAAIPLLREGARIDGRHGARIIALSSLTGLYAEPELAVYGATKAALTSFVETVNLDEAPHGVAASAIAPGYIDTDMTAGVEVATEEMIHVDDVVAVVEMLLKLSRTASVTKVAIARRASGGYRA